MDTISVVIIAKNSEHDIAKCLSSLSFCNEIIVVDSGSKDKTVDIAKKAGAVIIIDSSEDFAKRRNMGMKKAKGQWVLYV
ncbi:MAG: glycosyltransferase, partial [Candidatus Levyibacteriota bacterium]